MTELTVTGCGDCPLAVTPSGVYVCLHPKRTETDKHPFTTCPLKQASLLIKLANNDTSAPTTNTPN